ncbi:MAG: universal stress protein, partial [Acidobacteriota bacterium]|nr:universal stress protein [Acidobacteriota bacterium]
YLASIVKQNEGALTVCSVSAPDATEDSLKSFNKILNDTVSRVSRNSQLEVRSKVIRHQSVTEGILEEAEKYDAVVVGAAGQGLYAQIMFGSIPEIIAKESEKPVILVKHYHPVKALLARVMRE